LFQCPLHGGFLSVLQMDFNLNAIWGRHKLVFLTNKESS
jgi:hypothetical protein